MINHEFLKRQLKRNSLSDSDLPENLENWKTFLMHINKTYSDFDQDRYTVVRSLEVSSKEMQDLYNDFEEAQKIAHIGSWTYNLKKDKAIWSNEMYQLFNRELILGPPSAKEFLLYLNPNDRNRIGAEIKKCFYGGQDGGFEFCIMVKEEARWMDVKFRVLTKDDSGQVELITGTLADITERKLVEKKIAMLNDQLISAARRAGMAEVASGVMHNVGNVLNSLNVTASILLEKISNGKIDNIKKISELINLHKKNLGEFIENDPKGKYIPEYISNLALNWDSEQKNYIQYLTAMNEHIQHIKTIVSRHNSLGGSIGVIQSTMLNDLIEEAISIAISEQRILGIKIEKEYELLAEVLVDKAILLQILVNLIKNAKESLGASNQKNMQLNIKLKLLNSTTVSIAIEDNGVGIAPENIKKIFTYGFTTKEHGFGIGLHTSSLAAKGMGGKLEVFNLGKDRGAIFVLTFPYKIA